MHRIKHSVSDSVPPSILRLYHLALAYLGAAVYGNPSHQLLVIGVTGTKGKSSTTEMVNAIFEKAGYTTALLNSIRFKIAATSKPNRTRMSMPGRFFIQKFFRSAVQSGCTVAIIEMTSEGARQNRHRAIELDALIFTNLAPEHIESHGSYRAYADAKFEIAEALARSPKKPRTMVANADDAESSRYITLPVERSAPFSLSAHQPFAADESGGHFRFEDVDIAVHMPGEFSLKNALAAATLAYAFGIKAPVIAAALDTLTTIPGRAERVEAGQDFAVIVDYAHTPDSLTALYDAFSSPSTPLDSTRDRSLGTKRALICVLGSTGGGRDMWKRPVMGKIADERCEHVILANEDPYDEDPRSIVDSIARGMKRPPEIILDRREAISKALSLARPGDAVLITGKGTDPNIAVAHGKKIPWSDARVVREELEKLLAGARIIKS